MQLRENLEFSQEVLKEYGYLSRLQKKIGNTPLVKIDTQEEYATIYAKCESYNEGGTVKARVAFAMLWRLLSETPKEELKDLTIIEYSGGTLAKCLAEYCHMLNIKLVMVVSESTPPSIVERMRALDVDVRLIDKELGFYGVMKEAKALAAQNPNWKFLYQHTNEANQYIHCNTTGNEICNQLADNSVERVDAWIASIGTGGTLTGVYYRLAQQFPNVKVYATTPQEMPYGTACGPNALPKFSGSGGLGYGEKQPFVEPVESIIEAHLTYGYDETAALMKTFYKDTGVKIGSSSAANLKAALKVAKDLGPDGVVVTVFPCAGSAEEWDKLLAEKA